ncbi:PRC-barrel domain-containing protein [Streptomyces mutabilis]|uniref:PRC-barrel domain-containing protein n=1 Tax=Streptomyces mutabilis TaxID=67332 RepID=A0A086N7I9_9ACTN|nr:PRC-barrel domain-containing protein [Streptomyces mutabilis]KFG77107.1 hypothetical protein FM21_13965 [Streptomyces mutabilis]
MMLFTEVRGLPVLAPTRAGPLGTVTSLAADVASGTVSHVRFRGGRLRGDTVLPWDAVRSIGPGALRVESASAVPGADPPCHGLLDRRVLTDAGTEHGTVLDVAFDTETGRLLAVFTTRGEVPVDRLLGLGDHALVVRAG